MYGQVVGTDPSPSPTHPGEYLETPQWDNGKGLCSGRQLVQSALARLAFVPQRLKLKLKSFAAPGQETRKPAAQSQDSQSSGNLSRTLTLTTCSLTHSHSCSHTHLHTELICIDTHCPKRQVVSPQVLGTRFHLKQSQWQPPPSPPAPWGGSCPHPPGFVCSPRCWLGVWV